MVDVIDRHNHRGGRKERAQLGIARKHWLHILCTLYNDTSDTYEPLPKQKHTRISHESSGDKPYDVNREKEY